MIFRLIRLIKLTNFLKKSFLPKITIDEYNFHKTDFHMIFCLIRLIKLTTFLKKLILLKENNT